MQVQRTLFTDQCCRLSKYLTVTSRSLRWTLIFTVFQMLIALPTSYGSEGTSVRTSTQQSQAIKSSALGVEDLNFSIQGGRGENTFENHTLMKAEAEIKFKYKASPTFYFDFEPAVSYFSGFSQALDEKNSQNTEFQIYEATGNWQAWNQKFSFGALDQSDRHSSLLMEKQAFPGLRWTQYWLSSKEILVNTFIDGTIPTSTSTVAQTSEKESTPSLISAGARFYSQEQKSFSFKSNLNYFQFQNIPSIVSRKSVLLGNTGISTNSNEINQKLTYGFSGWETKNEFIFYTHPDFRILTIADAVYNTEAPTSLNTSYRLGGGAEWRLIQHHSLKATGYYFRTESDSIISAYSSHQYFQSNRVGYGSEVMWTLLQEKIHIGFNYTEAQVIIESPSQSLEKNLILKLEAYNVGL